MMSNPPFVYHRRSYFPEETQRQIYLLLCQCVPAVDIARRLSISVETVHSFRRRFGITTHYGRHWTQQEDWELRNLIDQNLSIDIIAKRLHRTVLAVQKRLNDHGIQRIHRNNSIYTVAQVGRILQVGIYSITRWIDQGLLKAKRIPRRKDKKSQSPRSFYRIDSLDLYDFLADPRHWHLYRVADITDEFLRRDLVAVHRETPRWLYDPEQLANWTPPNRAMNSIAVRAALAQRPELITIDQLAERFGVDREIAYYWYTRGWITAIKVGKVLMFDGEQLKDWEPPYVRDRKNAAYRPAENGDRPGDDRADERRRLEGGGAPGEWAAETDPQPGGGCESSALPELAQEAA